jgi:hypothetical protein
LQLKEEDAHKTLGSHLHDAHKKLKSRLAKVMGKGRKGRKATASY